MSCSKSSNLLLLRTWSSLSGSSPNLHGLPSTRKTSSSGGILRIPSFRWIRRDSFLTNQVSPLRRSSEKQRSCSSLRTPFLLQSSVLRSEAAVERNEMQMPFTISECGSVEDRSVQIYLPQAASPWSPSLKMTSLSNWIIRWWSVWCLNATRKRKEEKSSP